MPAHPPRQTPVRTGIRPLTDSAGQVAIFVALVITALLSTTALVADMGMVYQERRQLQTAVDAAALAGAMDLAEGRGPAAAGESVTGYIAQNANLPGADVQVAFPTGTAVRATAYMTRDTFFARLFKRNTVRIKASAIARYGAASKAYNLVPVIVPQQSVPGHIGAANEASFELGEDRPVDPLSISGSQNGNTVTYTITYVNTSNKAIDVSIWSPIPSGGTYVAGSATAGGTFDGTNARWSFSGVAAGDSRAMSYAITTSGGLPNATAYADSGQGRTESATTQGGQRGFFWLTDFDAGSGGVPDYDEWIVNGYPKAVGVGDLANGTGVKASLKSALDARVLKDALVVLPLFDYTEGGGHQGTYHVTGFAEFVITGFNLNGNPKTVTGYFTTGTVTPGVGGEDPPAYFGVNAVWLAE